MTTGTHAFPGTKTIAKTLAVTGIYTPTGGIAAAGGTTVVRIRPGCYHTGGQPAIITAEGIDVAPVTTEIYYTQFDIPCNMGPVTGIAVFNGSVASDSWHHALLDADGALVTGSATGSVVGGTADTYQKIPFTGGTINLLGPATYYIAGRCDGTTDRYNAHGTATTGLGFSTSFVAGVLTSQGSYAAIPATNTLTLTYTTDVGRIGCPY